jgi:hypothetical protein
MTSEEFSLERLERDLRELAAAIEYPTTPQIGRAVRARIEQTRRPRHLAASRPLALGVAAAVLALVLAGLVGLAVSPGFRSAVADRLGVGGASITQPERPSVTLPPATPTAVPSADATPAPPGTGLGLGLLTTLDEARRLVNFVPLLPAGEPLATPDAVYVLRLDPQTSQLTLAYAPVPGQSARAGGAALLIGEFHGRLDQPLLGKEAASGTRVTEVTVNGAPGFWLEGKPHTFYYLDAEGRIQPETIRLAGNTLLWQQGGLTLRIEGAASLDEALSIAGSLR